MPKNDHLEVIVKLAEVCNIACKYCYYFFSGDSRPDSRPSYMSPEIVSRLVGFLNEGFREGWYETIQIDFHGGEPLMIGLPNFNRILNTLGSGLEVRPKLAMTTNAMLISEKWIDTFATHSVNICVSIDGPQPTHDRLRIDKRGGGTYDRVRRGVDALQAAAHQGRIAEISALCVVQPKADGGQVYRHLVHDLGIRYLDFLLPDNTHDTFDAADSAAIASFIDGALSAWLADDDPSIQVRLFDSVFQLLMGGQSRLAGFGARASHPTAITIGSDGSVDGDDFLKPTGVKNIATDLTIFESSFSNIMKVIGDIGLVREISTVPDGCVGCAFEKCCGGGQATHRYSLDRRFNNPSVHCETQKVLFSQVASHLISTGLDPAIVAKNAMQ